MGHCVSMRYFDAKKYSKSKIESILDAEAAAESDWSYDGAGGLPNPIHWYDQEPLEDYEEAVKFLEKNDRHSYDQLAVRYYEVPESAKLKDLRERHKQVEKRIKDLDEKFYFEGQKRKYATCKECGSSINLYYMGKKTNRRTINNCPVCGNDMRPETALNQIDAARASRNKLRTKIKEEEKRLFAKSKKINWLVKYEYHV